MAHNANNGSGKMNHRGIPILSGLPNTVNQVNGTLRKQKVGEVINPNRDLQRSSFQNLRFSTDGEAVRVACQPEIIKEEEDEEFTEEEKHVSSVSSSSRFDDILNTRSIK